MYQHICAAAFGWLQGIHELKQKLEAAADNRHFKKLSHSIIDKCRWIYWLSCVLFIYDVDIKVINLNDLLFLLTLKAFSCYYCAFAGIIKFVIVDKICKVTAKQQTLQVILCQLSQIFIKKTYYMWKEETMSYLKIRAVFEIFKLVFTGKKCHQINCNISKHN